MKHVPTFSPAGNSKIGGVLLAAVVVLTGFAPAAVAQQRSIPVMVQTIPELPGARFSLDGNVFTADENGLALTVVRDPGTYNLRVVSKQMPVGDDVSRFSVWSDGQTGNTRSVNVQSFTYLQAGFSTERTFSLDFIDSEGDPVDPERIEAIGIADPQGGQKRLTGPGPYTLTMSEPTLEDNNLALQRPEYRIEDVIVDGEDVLDGQVNVSGIDGEVPSIELAASGGSEEPRAGPQSDGTSLPEVPSELLVAFVVVIGIVVLVFLGRKLNVATVGRSTAERVKSWSPGTHLRRLNPLPPLAAGARRLNPVPAIASRVRKSQEMRRERPKAAKPKAKETARPRPQKAPSSRTKGTSPTRSKPVGGASGAKSKPAPEATPPARSKPATGASAEKGGPEPQTSKPAPKPKPKKQQRPSEAKKPTEKSHSLNPVEKMTAAVQKRRLRAQLSDLQQSGPGAKVRKRQARAGALVEPKKSGRIALLWLRGSRSRGSMRDYARGPRVRIKLRNGHLIIGTIRRTPATVDQGAMNVFVERVYDQFGHEMVHSSEDTFVLPSQIVRIEKFQEQNKEENKVIRLPEPEDRVADSGPRRGGSG
jgi:hypothetical protein